MSILLPSNNNIISISILILILIIIISISSGRVDAANVIANERDRLSYSLSLHQLETFYLPTTCVCRHPA